MNHGEFVRFHEIIFGMCNYGFPSSQISLDFD
jgi:hypothetical protein